MNRIFGKQRYDINKLLIVPTTPGFRRKPWKWTKTACLVNEKFENYVFKSSVHATPLFFATIGQTRVNYGYCAIQETASLLPTN